MSPATDTLTPPSTTRSLLFSASGREAIQLVEAELKRLEDLYLKAFKRKIPPEILSLSNWGEPPRAQFGITAYIDASQADVLTFLRTQVTASPAFNPMTTSTSTARRAAA